MQQLPHLRAKLPSAVEVNRLIDQVNMLSRIVYGEGLLVRRTGSADVVGLSPYTGYGNPYHKRTPLGIVMGIQDTDAWKIGGETAPDAGAEVPLITDIFQDPSDLHLYIRYRVIKIDAGGRIVEITAESDPVKWSDTSGCP
jgi:hypothetical protein